MVRVRLDDRPSRNAAEAFLATRALVTLRVLDFLMVQWTSFLAVGGFWQLVTSPPRDLPPMQRSLPTYLGATTWTRDLHGDGRAT